MKNMKNKFLYVIIISVFLQIISVNNSYSQNEDLQKMKDNADKISVNVINNAIVVQENGKATLELSIKFPKNYFDKNTKMTIVPSISFDNGLKKEPTPISFYGESLSENPKIPYIAGGTQSYTGSINYTKDLQNPELILNANLYNDDNSIIFELYSKSIGIKYWNEESKPKPEVEADQQPEDEKKNVNGKHDEAHYLKAIDEAKQNNDFETASLYMDTLATLYESQEQFIKAAEILEQSLELQKDVGNKNLQTTILAKIAGINFKLQNFGIANERLNEAIRIKTEINDTTNLAILYSNKGVISQTQSNYGLAIVSYQKAIEIKETEKDAIGIAKLNYQISTVYYEQDDYGNAIKSYNQIIQIEENTNNAEELNASYNNLGVLYSESNDYSNAKKSLNKANKHFKNTKDTLSEAKTLNNLGNNSFYQGKDKYDEALAYYEQSLAIKQQSPEKNKKSIAISLHNIANVYAKKGNFEKAIEYYIKSNKLVNQTESKEVVYKNNYNLAQLEADKEECSSAMYYYKKYINSRFNLDAESQNPISEKINKYIIQIEKELLIAELDKTKEDLINQKQLTKIAELEKENQAAKAKLYKWVSIAVGLGLLIAIILAILFLREYKLKKKEHEKVTRNFAVIKQQNEEITSQAEQLRQANEEIITINEDLKQQKEELQTTLDNLKKMQSQLVESEKMASLGQLIAGVAHELNTPLGAINSSINNVRESMKYSMEKLPELIKILSEEEYKQFFALLALSNSNKTHYSSREIRKLKRELRNKFEAENCKNAEIIAETLADMKIFENYEQFNQLFKNKNIELLLNVAYHLTVQQQNSQNISIAVSRSSKIITALRNYSHKYDTDEMTETDITQGLETVLTLYNNKFRGNINIYKKYATVPMLKCYPDELNQVWTNIINNAYQAMDGKGNIHINISQEKAHIKVAIKDEGKGMPEEIWKDIFVPFFTTKIAGEGTGLGLDISRKIVEKHKGKITFESKVGVGTTFFVYLPVK